VVVRPCDTTLRWRPLRAALEDVDAGYVITSAGKI
jgi:hypothetical protein